MSDIEAFKAKFSKRSPALDKVTEPELVGPPHPWDVYLGWLALTGENPRLRQFQFDNLLNDVRERVLQAVRDQALRKVQERAEAQALADAEASRASLQELLERESLGNRLGAW